ncbi:MAG: polysaccharide biosynthesis/export family protein [Verrucomicrobiales bacterium]|nr:polysaccharide export protein, outer membrane [Nitrospinaceae bacterium]
MNKKNLNLLCFIVLVSLMTACGGKNVFPSKPKVQIQRRISQRVRGPVPSTEITTDTAPVERKLSNSQKLVSLSPLVPSSLNKEDHSEYVLGAEDLLEVNVWKNADLSKIVLIRPDGKISLPLIGDVQASGLTVTELKEAIVGKLKHYKEIPVVSVIVKEVNSFSVFILGEVNKPGKLKLRSETTLLQVLTLSGGFTQFAARDKIILLRREHERERRIKINYTDIITGKDPEGNILLKRGDTIIVP